MFYLFVTITLLIIIMCITTCRQTQQVHFKEMFEEMVQKKEPHVTPIENILALAQLIDNKQASIELTVKKNSKAIITLTKEVTDLKSYIKQQVDSLSEAAT